MQRYTPFFLFFILALVRIQGEHIHLSFTSGIRYLLIDVLDDDLLHFEVSEERSLPSTNPIYSTQMIDKTNYPGPSFYSAISSNNFETNELRFQVDATTLHVSIYQKDGVGGEYLLTTFSYAYLQNSQLEGKKQLKWTKEFPQTIYGLGQRFLQPATSEYNWNNRIWYRVEQGNKMECPDIETGGGSSCSGITQMPVMYALSSQGDKNFAFFFDNVYSHYWDLGNEPFVESYGDHFRWYFFSGQNLSDLRQDYMELVGRPLVPPKRYFGLWQSRFGYTNWNEIYTVLESLTDSSTGLFPLDGVVFDLQWFGGNFYSGQSDEFLRNSSMGRLRWDQVNFPNVKAEVDNLRYNFGLGITLIEESYLSEYTDGFITMSARNGVPTIGSNPVILTENKWWGLGSMIDWSNSDAAEYWFDCKRCRLIEDCVVDQVKCFETESTVANLVTAFWTDLGEPEMYNGGAIYHGYYDGDKLLNTHGDIHNIYQLLWAKSIYEGFIRHNISTRPFILSRSGTSGLQRYGAAMWSGDVGSKLIVLTQHMGAQKDVVMAGIDYYGSDIGGFHRDRCTGSCDIQETYTQWMANSAWFDIPMRPHAWDLQNDRPTAPSQIGDLHSNLFNVRQRYELTPYYYSLAHRAYLYGEPVIPPLFYYYQRDQATHSQGGIKMIGKEFLVGISTTEWQRSRGMYLPEGFWFNYHTVEILDSQGAWFENQEQAFYFEEYCNNPSDKCIFTLPAFVRAGAIIPMMPISPLTKNTLGETWGGPNITELVVRVFAHPEVPEGHNFTLYEDDGVTQEYLAGAVRTTNLEYYWSQYTINVFIQASQGTYHNAPSSRDFLLRIELPSECDVTLVNFNSNPLTEYSVFSDLTSNDGWTKNPIRIRHRDLSVSINKQFSITTTCLSGELPPTTPTTSSPTSTTGSNNVNQANSIQIHLPFMILWIFMMWLIM